MSVCDRGMYVCAKNKYRKHIMCVFMKYTIVHVIVICAKFTFMMEYRKCLEVISVLLVSGLLSLVMCQDIFVISVYGSCHSRPRLPDAQSARHICAFHYIAL